MTTPRRRGALAAVGLTFVSCAILTTPALATAGPRAASSDEPATTVDVPVHGVPVPIRQSREADKPIGYGAVHGVQRVDGATVLYYSLGWHSDTLPEDAQSLALYPRLTGNERFNGTGIGIAQARVVDPIGRKAYTTLVHPRGTGSLSSSHNAVDEEIGTLFVVYQVLPELPVEVETVDVWLGQGSIVSGVPVGEGLLEPTVSGDEPIALGTGWPAVDLDLVAQSPEPQLSVYDLEQRSSNLDETQTTTETPDSVSIDVSSDVLFALDSAELSAEAGQRIAAVASEINARAASGEIAVVGHTDSQGSDQYNDDLSQRRAQAVADALGPAVTISGANLRVEGRGEDEPVADNDTPEGQQANRRVTITFTPKS